MLAIHQPKEKNGDDLKSDKYCTNTHTRKACPKTVSDLGKKTCKFTGNGCFTAKVILKNINSLQDVAAADACDITKVKKQVNQTTT